MGKKTRYIPLDLTSLPSITEGDHSSREYTHPTILPQRDEQSNLTLPSACIRKTPALEEPVAVYASESKDTLVPEDSTHDNKNQEEQAIHHDEDESSGSKELANTYQEHKSDNYSKHGGEEDSLQGAEPARRDENSDQISLIGGLQQHLRLREHTPALPCLMNTRSQAESIFLQEPSSLEARSTNLSPLTPRPTPHRPPLTFRSNTYQAAPWGAPRFPPIPPLHAPRGYFSQQRRKGLQSPPIPGKVYYMPDGRFFPHSVIHSQSQKDGFFKHPMLVVGTEGPKAYFYALTKAPPHAIRELNMCLRIGDSEVDEGTDTLTLAPGSQYMNTATWVNLEQRYHIEWRNLDSWAMDVRVHANDLWKLWKRVQELEADQNRYIYKPLPRNMRLITPGTVLMLPNDEGSSTLGAPVLVLENLYPLVRFLRVKKLADNVFFNAAARRRNVNSRPMCLQISRTPGTGHDGTPLLLLEPQSPAMREPSYVEIRLRPKMAKVELCKTWCWPPVCIQPLSMQVLSEYIGGKAEEMYGTGVGSRTNLGSHTRESSVCHSSDVAQFDVGHGASSSVGRRLPYPPETISRTHHLARGHQHGGTSQTYHDSM